MGTSTKPKRPLGRRNIISRAQVMSAALQLIAERGVAGCTMADTARLLDVSVMALYTYFPSRDALLAAAADEAFAQLELPEEQDDWRKFLCDWMTSLDDYLTRYPATRALIFSNGRMPGVWTSVWMPILRMLSSQGVAGAELAVAAEWFGRSAFEAIAGHHHPVSHDVIHDILEHGRISDEDREIIERLVVTHAGKIGDARWKAHSHALFRFSLERIITGLEVFMQKEERVHKLVDALS